MNIYNTLYFLEYTRDPHVQYHMLKRWYMNLSKHKFYERHRDFDLPARTNEDFIFWILFGKLHRLIGPACIKKNDFKEYYIRDEYYKRLNKRLNKSIT